MSAIKLNSSGGGSITISPASTASTLTLTAPAQTGTIGLDGPAFSVYRTGLQTGFASGTFTKVQCQTEEFDTANCYDNSTNYRFTPNVAGYYQINFAVVAAGTNISYIQANLYKNGSIYKTATYNATAAAEAGSTGSTIVYFNGSTDYVELYSYLNVTSGTGAIYGGTTAPIAQTYFNGCMVRAA